MKISIIGAGNVGSLTAMRLAQENLGSILLVDIIKGIAQGKSFDLDDARYILKSNYKIEGTDDISKIKDSGIVIITAGLPRKPGMTREDLLQKNTAILKDVCAKIKSLARQAIIIVVTNPLDIMTYFALKNTSFERNKVIGMGVSLDASRFANLIANELNVPVDKIDAMVIGSHGEGMIPLANFTTINNVPLSNFLGQEAINSLIERTVLRGAEIVSLLGNSSAYFAPSAQYFLLLRQ